MFQHTLNELRVTIEIRPRSPLLIKDGRHREHDQKEQMCFLEDVERTPRSPRLRKALGFGSYSDPDLCFDMAFVWRRTRDQGDQFYIPGSSLRGVVRSAAERIVGRWRPDLARQGDPVGRQAYRSEQWIHDERKRGAGPSSSVIYAAAGPIERCFGHTALRGRWVFDDAPMRDQRAAAVMVRDGVGIDRDTGAAAENIKFSFETITGGVFVAELTITNYELWQLGLLAHVFATLDSGSVRMGYGTHRGLGRIALRVTQLHWRWYPAAFRQPDLATGTARIPALAELAAHAHIPDPAAYAWRDGPESGVSAPEVLLQGAEQVAGLVPTWASPLSAGADLWQEAPWPQLGPLLPAALEQWPHWAHQATEGQR